jgi:hypothetical protein
MVRRWSLIGHFPILYYPQAAAARGELALIEVEGRLTATRRELAQEKAETARLLAGQESLMPFVDAAAAEAAAAAAELSALKAGHAAQHAAAAEAKQLREAAAAMAAEAAAKPVRGSKPSLSLSPGKGLHHQRSSSLCD